MANQPPTLSAPGHTPRWRLAGLTLLVLAMHAGALAWWLNSDRPPADRVVAAPTVQPSMVSMVNAVNAVEEVRLVPPTPLPATLAPASGEVAAKVEAASASAHTTPPAPDSKKNQSKQALALVNKELSATPLKKPTPASAATQATNTNTTTEPAAAPPGVVLASLPVAAGDIDQRIGAPPPQAPETPEALGVVDAPGAPVAPGAPLPTEAPAHAAPPATTLLASSAPAAAPSSQPRSTATKPKLAPQPATERATVAKHISVPPSRVLEYRVRASRKGLTLPADSTLTWQTDGNSYSASMVFEAMFGRSRSQTSVGTIDPALGLQPRRFGDKNRSEVATHFDRSRQPPAIRFSNNAPDVPLQASTQDRLSVLVQLAAMVAGEPNRYPPGQAVVLHTANSRDADLWRFVVTNAEAVDLPVGRLDTVHLTREAANPYDNRVEVWLAPSLGHLPVRILWTQANGDVVDQQLSAHQP